MRREKGETFCEIVEHVDSVLGEGQVGAALPLVLAEVPGPTGLLRRPLGGVRHALLHLVDPLQRVQALVQQERRVVHHHAAARLLHLGAESH